MTTAALAVPGASLYHEVRGSGPLLLVIPSGNGDATPFAPLAEALAHRYTVVTYDRRGYSRSPGAEVDPAERIAVEADDAAALLAHFTDRPARVFGSSSGAILALALLLRHPERVGTLVAHEPPLASVLPDSAHWLGFYQELYRTYLAEGVKPARKLFLATMGMTKLTKPPRETELPEAEQAALLARIQRNHEHWFEREVRTFPAYLPDAAALRAQAHRLVLAGGTTSRGTFPYRPNEVLSRWSGVPITALPGGHVGYVTDPFAFADALGAVLDARGGDR